MCGYVCAMYVQSLLKMLCFTLDILSDCSQLCIFMINFHFLQVVMTENVINEKNSSLEFFQSTVAHIVEEARQVASGLQYGGPPSMNVLVSL